MTAGKAAGAGGGGMPRAIADYLGMLGVLLALIVFFSLTAPNFLTVRTFQTIANQAPDAIVIAVGMTFVLIIGGIDLSVGSVMALSGAVLGVGMAQWGWSLPTAAAVGLGVGLLCGAANGALTVRWPIPSFIVTLGMMEIARGAAYLTVSSQTQYVGSRIGVLADTRVLGLSLPFLIAIAVVVVGQAVLSGTTFGRHVLAIGANEEAARLSGLATGRSRLIVFAACGMLSGLASVILVSRMASADPNMGTGYELQAIAAVVIGGTSLMGGRGSVVKSFFGVLIIAVLGYGLAQMGAQDPTKRVVTGAVIVAAVIADYYRGRMRR